MMPPQALAAGGSLALGAIACVGRREVSGSWHGGRSRHVARQGQCLHCSPHLLPVLSAGGGWRGVWVGDGPGAELCPPLVPQAPAPQLSRRSCFWASSSSHQWSATGCVGHLVPPGAQHLPRVTAWCPQGTGSTPVPGHHMPCFTLM